MLVTPVGIWDIMVLITILKKSYVICYLKYYWIFWFSFFSRVFYMLASAMFIALFIAAGKETLTVTITENLINFAVTLNWLVFTCLVLLPNFLLMVSGVPDDMFERINKFQGHVQNVSIWQYTVHDLRREEISNELKIQIANKHRLNVDNMRESFIEA